MSRSLCPSLGVKGHRSMLRACTMSWVEVLSSSVGLLVLQAGPVLALWDEGDSVSYISLVCSWLYPEPVATSPCRQRNAAPLAACDPSPLSPGWSRSSAAQGLKKHATGKRHNTLLANLSEIELSIKPMFLFACNIIACFCQCVDQNIDRQKNR